jgi:hypothetical protein
MGTICCCGRKSVARANTPKTIVSTKPSARIQREQSGKFRFSDIGVSATNHSKLIGGYEKESLVSLEEALKSFHGKIDNLEHHIKEAKAKCCHPSKHKLTQDESAAIYIYTMKWSKISLFDHLKSAWKTEQRSALVPWFKYLKLFKIGLDKLPDAKGEVWQAAPFNEDQKKLLTSNSKPLYASMSSGLLSEHGLRGHFGKDSAGRMIFVSYAFINGKVLTGYTADHGEEVLLWPGSKLGKAEFNETSGGILFVHFNRKHSEYYFHYCSFSSSMSIEILF